MNAGKSTLLLQASYNYRERGMRTVLFIAAFDDRGGAGRLGPEGSVWLGGPVGTRGSERQLRRVLARRRRRGYLDRRQLAGVDIRLGVRRRIRLRVRQRNRHPASLRCHDRCEQDEETGLHGCPA